MSDLVRKPTNRVLITVEDRTFDFEKKQLTGSSLCFEKMLNGSYKESEQSEIVLHDVGAEEFQLFRDIIFGIKKDFKDLDRDILLGLVVLADRFLLNDKFCKECYKMVKFWMIRDVSFPMKVLQTAMYISDKRLKDIFINWLYGRELKDPFRSKWTLKELRATIKATLAFHNKKFAALTVQASEEVKEEMNTLFIKHIQKLKSKADELMEIANEIRDREKLLSDQLDEIRVNFGENAEYQQHSRLMNEEFKRMNQKETDILANKIAIL